MMAQAQFTHNPNIIKSNVHFISVMTSQVRNTGGCECWVLNKNYMEIYHFTFTRISEFDVQIDLVNSLEEEHVATIVLTLHMKDKIIELLEEVPGTFYLDKFECHQELYTSLYDKFNNAKTKKTKHSLVEKIEFLECEFPHMVL
mgnify:CR=1 FL=1